MTLMLWHNAYAYCTEHGESLLGLSATISFQQNKCSRDLSFLLHKDGTLASIEDPSEQEFIQSHARIFQDKHDSFWIGLIKGLKGNTTP